MAMDLGGRHAEAERGVRVAGADAEPRRVVARVLHRERDQGSDARHQRRLLRGDRGLAALPLHRRHRLPTGALADGGTHDRLRTRVPDRDRRDRVAGGRPGRRRAAHRIVEHPPQHPVRDRDCRAARPRTAGLGAVTRRARHRTRPPARALPRQAALGDGLVLPDPWRCPARPGRARRGSPTTGTRSWSRAAASGASRTNPGSPRPKPASS